MKNIIMFIWALNLVIVCFILLALFAPTEKSDSPILTAQTWSISASGVIEQVQSQVQWILDDREVQKTLERIEKDAPLYNRDGATFMNREKLLPVQKNKNYYSEWTVKTPWESDRGARRIVEGKWGELYFTDDHYSSFTRIR